MVTGAIVIVLIVAAIVVADIVSIKKRARLSPDDIRREGERRAIIIARCGL